MDTLLPIAARAGALLKARGETIAVAESASGGLVSAALLAVPGPVPSPGRRRGLYAGRRAPRSLGVQPRRSRRRAPASEEMAALLAQAARERLGAIWGLGEAGAAGPTGNSYGHAAGHGVFAVAGPVGRSLTIETGDGDRVGNMRVFSAQLLTLLVECLEAAPRQSN